MIPNPQHIMLLHHLRRFLEVAAAEGIDAAPLKGAHLITGVYPPGEDRGAMSDVDMLVRPRDFEGAGRVLESLGYVRRELPGRRRTEEEFYEAGYALELEGGRRVFFELHRYLVQPQRNPVDYEALWGRSTASELDGAPCRRLTSEDHLLHAAMHLMTDRFEAPGRALRDAQHLIGRGGADLPVAVKRAGRWRCARALWLMLSLLAESAPESRSLLDPLLVMLRPPAPAQAILRALVPGPGGLRWPDLDMRTGQALLWPSLFDGPRDLVSFGAHYLWLRVLDLTR